MDTARLPPPWREKGDSGELSFVPFLGENPSIFGMDVSADVGRSLSCDSEVKPHVGDTTQIQARDSRNIINHLVCSLPG